MRTTKNQAIKLAYEILNMKDTKQSDKFSED